jgi:hypothetical protein
MKLARESRLALREIRINAEAKRKELKEDSLRRGKAIDGIANVIKFLIEPVESYLLTQEKFSERVEEARIAALVEERTRTLTELNVNPCFYNLGSISDADFNQIVSGAQLAKLAAIEAQRKADEDRIKRQQEEAAERERIRLENETLKAQALEREAIAKAEREASVKAAAVAKAKADAEKARLESIAKAEREAREKLEAEKLAAKRADEKRAADEAAEIERKNSAPDREKLKAFMVELEALKLPVVSAQFNPIIKSVREHIYYAIVTIEEGVK